MYDIIIKNGTIIDGSGDPMKKSDIGVREGEIKELGDLSNEKADLVIDAQGKYVTPGFIDVNNHSDTYWRIFNNPELESLIHQGITSIIGGNCGSSLAPLVDHEIIKSIQKWADIRSVNLDWLKMTEFLDAVDKNNLSLNFGSLVGHSTLRRGFLKDEVRDLTSDEFKSMKKLLKSAMKEGAMGLSTGLVYTHAKLAKTDELIELAKIVAKYNGVYTTHIRGESNELLKSIEEAIEIARESNVKLHISHLKAVGKNNWPLMDDAISLIETAKSNDIDVSFDVYPYTATGSVLYILLPDWVAKGGKKMMLERLKDSSMRTKVVAEMKNNNVDYSKVVISISPLNKTLSRRNIVDIAKAQGKTVEDAIIDILIASGGRVITTMEVLSEKNMIKAIQNPFAIIASNGSGYNFKHKDTGEVVHPRNFGAFPKVFSKYVRDEKIISWEEAINKMTGKPAEKFNIRKRGLLKNDYYADLLVIDPEKIKDWATVENPYQYSTGIDYVLVNGRVALKKDQFNDKKAGEIIRLENSIWM